MLCPLSIHIKDKYYHQIHDIMPAKVLNGLIIH